MLQALTVNEIRQRWIQFFKGKGHKHIPADSLVPRNDPSVLFTGAGMNQFKDHFAGAARIEHPQQRAVTVQPCVRASDIDNVGRTPSHHACFEMLGNFSFGDYFKNEAIEWAVEFLLDPEKGLGLQAERLSVTVFGGDERLGIPRDEEAVEAWKRHAPWLRDERAPGGWRIYGYGEHDNFWPADAPSKGPNGPCGPCSEIFFDTHPQWAHDPAQVPPPRPVASDEKRYCEIWNLVFTQFNRLESSRLEPLPKKNIDTGAGLERMARVLQNKPSNFENDLLFPIVQQVAQRAGKRYGDDAEDDRRMRRITDHVRFAVMAVADGVIPKNEGRNYVLRRLMRRAMLDGQELGVEDTLLAHVAQAVIRQMSGGYPELQARQETLLRIIQEEERSFKRTLSQGREHFAAVVEKTRRAGQKTISGGDAFRLWDTFGFPLELTVESAHVSGLGVDEAGFQNELDIAVRRSQAGSQIAKEIFASGPVAELGKRFASQATVFEGYEHGEARGVSVLAIVSEETLVDRADHGEATVLLDRTSFYAESGGQVGDKGWLRGADTRHAVTDTQKHEGLVLHHVTLSGALAVGDRVDALVDEAHRAPTLKNHSATHLLHYALHETLGAHVEQRGSLVTPERLRFDFTHFEAVTPEQIQTVESLVNEQIQQDVTVDARSMGLAEAKASGARALFGEKYGDRVRVVQMGPSKELCGGTHCGRTGQIGYFRILSEGAIAAGVRRLEAVTGQAAVAEARRADRTLAELADLLKTHRDDLATRVKAMQEERSALERELTSFKRKAAHAAAGDLLSNARSVAGTQLLTAAMEGADPQALRSTLDSLRKTLPEGAVVLAGVKEGKLALLVSLSQDLVRRGGHAGQLLKEIAPIVGGRGGGKPELAQGGGQDPDKLPEAFEKAEGVLSIMLKSQ